MTSPQGAWPGAAATSAHRGVMDFEEVEGDSDSQEDEEMPEAEVRAAGSQMASNS